jgi:hypothetical protein
MERKSQMVHIYSYRTSKPGSSRHSQTKLCRNSENPESWNRGVKSQVKSGHHLQKMCLYAHTQAYTQALVFLLRNN